MGIGLLDNVKGALRHRTGDCFKRNELRKEI